MNSFNYSVALLYIMAVFIPILAKNLGAMRFLFNVVTTDENVLDLKGHCKDANIEVYERAKDLARDYERLNSTLVFLHVISMKNVELLCRKAIDIQLEGRIVCVLTSSAPIMTEDYKVITLFADRMVLQSVEEDLIPNIVDTDAVQICERIKERSGTQLDKYVDVAVWLATRDRDGMVGVKYRSAGRKILEAAENVIEETVEIAFMQGVAKWIENGGVKTVVDVGRANEFQSSLFDEKSTIVYSQEAIYIKEAALKEIFELVFPATSVDWLKTVLSARGVIISGKENWGTYVRKARLTCQDKPYRTGFIMLNPHKVEIEEGMPMIDFAMINLKEE